MMNSSPSDLQREAPIKCACDPTITLCCRMRPLDQSHLHIYIYACHHLLHLISSPSLYDNRRMWPSEEEDWRKAAPRSADNLKIQTPDLLASAQLCFLSFPRPLLVSLHSTPLLSSLSHPRSGVCAVAHESCERARITCLCLASSNSDSSSIESKRSEGFLSLAQQRMQLQSDQQQQQQCSRAAARRRHRTSVSHRSAFCTWKSLTRPLARLLLFSFLHRPRSIDPVPRLLRPFDLCWNSFQMPFNRLQPIESMLRSRPRLLPLPRNCHPSIEAPSIPLHRGSEAVISRTN